MAQTKKVVIWRVEFYSIIEFDPEEVDEQAVIDGIKPDNCPTEHEIERESRGWSWELLSVEDYPDGEN